MTIANIEWKERVEKVNFHLAKLAVAREEKIVQLERELADRPSEGMLHSLREELAQTEASRQAFKDLAEKLQAEGAGGWRCYRCGELFTDGEKAKEHFGSNRGFIRDGENGEVAACVDPLREDEKSRLIEVRKLREELTEAKHQIAVLFEANDDLGGQVARYFDELERYFGECGGLPARTPHQAWLKLEAAQNLAQANGEGRDRAEALLLTFLTRLGGSVDGFECGHGMPFNVACQDCGAGAVDPETSVKDLRERIAEYVKERNLARIERDVARERRDEAVEAKRRAEAEALEASGLLAEAIAKITAEDRE